MRIHNIIEDIVIKKVEELFSDKSLSDKILCRCEQCELDVICFVLNNITPHYVVSGRGAARFEADYLEKLQRDADLVSMIHLGIEKVFRAKRPHFEHKDTKKKNQSKKGAYYNLPTITGRINESNTFEPARDVTVSLFYKDKLVVMLNPNWQNPQIVSPKTNGMFNFWPVPLSAGSPGKKKNFDMELVIEKEGFETLKHHFTVKIESENEYIDYFRFDRKVVINELHLSEIIPD